MKNVHTARLGPYIYHVLRPIFDYAESEGDLKHRQLGS
jgi:hypothetical protein